MKVVFDIETDALYKECTKIHIIVCKEVETGKVVKFYEEDRALFEQYTKYVTLWVGHNIVGFDFPVLKKLWGIEMPVDKCMDTLIMSKVIDPDRLTGHSLKSWGEELGVAKVENEEWGELSENMELRCLIDVDIQLELYNKLTKIVEEYPGWEFPIKIEHAVQNIITQQEIIGWEFDTKKAHFLCSILDKACDKLEKMMEPSLEKIMTRSHKVSKPFKKDGTMSATYEKYKADPDYIEKEDFVFEKWELPNLRSRKQMIDVLSKKGWKAINYTKLGSPKLDEDSLIMWGKHKEIIHWYVYNSRRAQIYNKKDNTKGWIANVREDGRIESQINPQATNTGRGRHRVVVNVPSAGALFGKACRSLFIAKEGFSLVGVDAKGLELRVLAHYINDPTYTKTLLEGDIHSYNMELAGLKTRSQAKTFIYAFLYGAGAEKIGSIVNGNATKGQMLKKRFLSAVPALSRLISNVEQVSERGYVKAIDGRKIFLRKSEKTGKYKKHTALNSLLQSSGSIIFKSIMCYSHAILKNKLGKNYTDTIRQVGWFHDEVQFECKKGYEELLTNAVHLACKVVTERLKINVPIESDVKIGKNWEETH